VGNRDGNGDDGAEEEEIDDETKEGDAEDAEDDGVKEEHGDFANG
jgi:hypothetical protein